MERDNNNLAIIYPDGEKHWYKNGELYTPKMK